MRKSLIIALSLLLSLFLASNIAAKQRGLKIVAQTPSGKTIPLYGHSYALIIGNGNYAKGWDPLPGAIQDVKDVARALKENGFDKVILKTNLTLNGFKRAFGNFFYKYGRDKNNRLLFYYAGHGYTQKMANDEDLGYLVMVDAPVPEKDPVGFNLSSVDMQTIVTQAKLTKARHVLFMFDSCFSGSILNLRERVTPESISENVRLPVRQFITAGRSNEPVPDHSIFKQAFLDLLEGRDKEPIPDGYITGEELGLYLKNKVPQYNPTQHPQYGKIKDIHLDKGDFVFQLASSGATVDRPSPSRTTLSVTSNVSGARVSVDGKQVGTTPLDDTTISSGEHTIKVEKPGYEPYRKRMTIDRGRAVSLYVDLDKEGPLKARLYVDTEPSGATVRILNIGPSFYQGMKLDPGRYHVEVTSDKHETWEKWVTLDAGEDRNLMVKLEPVSASAGATDGGQVKTFTVNGVSFKMVKIPAGEFMMGSGLSPEEVERRYGGEAKYYKDEHPQHRVRIPQPFWIGETEVTQGLWQAVMGSNPSNFKNCGDDCPVEQVSWNDCREFIKTLNAKVPNGNFRLPTEAEWEYACRAGTTGPFARDLNAMGWYSKNSGIKTHRVARKQPNAWGLYDMHGNVWEWCRDWYGDYPSGTVTDPTGPSSGAFRVGRGGGWSCDAGVCRSALRFRGTPGDRNYYLGFRLARTN